MCLFGGDRNRSKIISCFKRFWKVFRVLLSRVMLIIQGIFHAVIVVEMKNQDYKYYWLLVLLVPLVLETFYACFEKTNNQPKW